MPRNGSGSYSLPEAAFIPNTAISSAAVNSDFSDIATALTGSLARDGQGGMTAVLPLANAGLTYLNDPNTGMRRTAADTQAISAGGVDTVTVTSTGISITGTLAVSGVITIGGAALLPIGLGPLPWSGLTAPSKWVLANGQSLLRASYPDLWSFAQTEIAGGNTLYTNGNGTTTFTVPDMNGSAPFGPNFGTGRLTTANSGVDGDVLGATGGLPNPTLVNANFPPYTPAGTITNGAITFPASVVTSVANGANLGMTTGPSTTNASLTAILVPQQATTTFAGTAQGGTSTPVKTQPRTVITNFIIFAGV